MSTHPVFSSPPELIVVTSEDANISALEGRFTAFEGKASLLSESLNEIVRSGGGISRHAMAETAEKLTRGPAAMVPDVSKRLLKYFAVDAPVENLEAMAVEFRGAKGVTGAYVKPPTTPPVWLMDEVEKVTEVTSPDFITPPASPNFTGLQGYLAPAPQGISAQAAWALPGGGGDGVRIVDVEGGWDFDHEDLLQNAWGLIAGQVANDVTDPQRAFRNHGTAVMGAMSGDYNAIGVTGICPGAAVAGSSHFGIGSKRAIVEAAMKLGPGDVILLEMHRPGPAFGFVNDPAQRGFIAVEWWPDDFEAIAFAVSRGIIVIEAAGNGAQNLDAPIYDKPAQGFPPGWRNPFRRSPFDSGAIIVGAGAPPSGAFGPDRSRLAFSNFGSCVDAQGWGREVTTCGYGDLLNSVDPAFRYTRSFSGTSSASPIIAGAIACLQGIRKAAKRPPLSPAQCRQLLYSTGSPQQANNAEHIGNRPNLQQLISAMPA